MDTKENIKNIKQKAYNTLGFSSDESELVDCLLRSLITMNGLDAGQNPSLKHYENEAVMMAQINAFLQRYALRAGERTDIKQPIISDENLASLEKVFTKLGMVDAICPSRRDYDVALCYGAPEVGVRQRVGDLAKIVSNPSFKIKNIVVLGADRKLWPLKKTGKSISFPEPILYDILAERLSARDGKEVSAEEIKNFVLNMDTKETAVEKISEEVAVHPYFKGIKWPNETDLILAVIKENPVFEKEQITVVRTPDFPDGSRANTGRTVYFAVMQNPKLFVPGATVLAISSQPFIRNQKTVTLQNLPNAVNLEVVGEEIKKFTPKQAMICIDSFARTVHANFSHYKENEKMKKMLVADLMWEQKAR